MEGEKGKGVFGKWQRTAVAGISAAFMFFFSLADLFLPTCAIWPRAFIPRGHFSRLGLLHCGVNIGLKEENSSAISLTGFKSMELTISLVGYCRKLLPLLTQRLVLPVPVSLQDQEIRIPQGVPRMSSRPPGLLESSVTTTVHAGLELCSPVGFPEPRSVGGDRWGNRGGVQHGSGTRVAHVLTVAIPTEPSGGRARHQAAEPSLDGDTQAATEVELRCLCTPQELLRCSERSSNPLM